MKRDKIAAFLAYAICVMIIVVCVATAFGLADSEPLATPDEVEAPVVEAEETTPTPTAEPTSTPTPTPTPEAEEEEDDGNPDDIVDYGNLVVYEGAGYELYTYVDDVSKRYAAAVSSAKEKLGDSVNVYDMVIPLSSSIVLPKGLHDDISSSDQEEAVGKIYDALSGDVVAVNIYDTLEEHDDEYIYFRTDHHWTALGAYYAYVEYCEARGTEPASLDDFEEKEFDGFIGSFYNDTEDASLAANPDTIVAYDVVADNTVYVSDDYNSEEGYYWKLISDVSDVDASVKYSTFAGADSTFVTITNNEITDGSACIIVKESFGNAFVPFLVNDYQNVYVVDYRYYQGNLYDLVAATGATDVIFCNNISMTRNNFLVANLETFVAK